MSEIYSAEEITEWLSEFDRENPEKVNDLFVTVYDELRRQAHRFLQKERRGHTLQTTALVHEAYMRLVGQRKDAWESRSQFFAIAAILMRRILIDYARQKNRIKRGGPGPDLPIEETLSLMVSDTGFDLLALDEALNRLAKKDPQLARIVELRFFSGLDVPDTAHLLGVSESTVKRDWAMAKAWLHRELTK